MANEICPVCKSKISFFVDHSVRESLHSEHLDDLIKIHANCLDEFDSNPEQYGGKPIEMSDETTDIDEETKKAQIEVVKERQQSDKEINDKSVHVISFDMPFGDMVMFMVKWAIASIPAFIILTIIGAIIVAIFGSLFF